MSRSLNTQQSVWWQMLFFSQKSYLKCVVINIAKIKTNHLIGERLTGLHQKSRCAAVSTCDSL